MQPYNRKNEIKTALNLYSSELLNTVNNSTSDSYFCVIYTGNLQMNESSQYRLALHLEIINIQIKNDTIYVF